MSVRIAYLLFRGRTRFFFRYHIHKAIYRCLSDLIYLKRGATERKDNAQAIRLEASINRERTQKLWEVLASTTEAPDIEVEEFRIRKVIADLCEKIDVRLKSIPDDLEKKPSVRAQVELLLTHRWLTQDPMSLTEIGDKYFYSKELLDQKEKKYISYPITCILKGCDVINPALDYLLSSTSWFGSKEQLFRCVQALRGLSR